MSPIPSLHLYSEYSLLQSTITISKLIAFATANHLKQLVLTDHNTLSGVAEFLYKCKENQIKAIIGLDLDVEDFQLILIARNYQGYQELIRLSSKKQIGESIELKEIDFPNLVVIDHPQKGYEIIRGSALPISTAYSTFGDNTRENFLEVQENKILDFSENAALRILREIEGVTTSTKAWEDLKPYAILDNSFPTYLKQKEILDSINWSFPEYDSPLPDFPLPDGYTKEEFLKLIIGQNMHAKFGDNIHKVYADRLKFELEIIVKLGFENYFLVIWDFIKWAREQKIMVGPGRGSSAGSLVSFCLGITEVDPIKYNLLFERFLNIERISLPDIDIDIQDDRRQEVIQYLFQKYGRDHVALISTFARIGAKTALRDVARIYNFPARDINTVSKLIPLFYTLQEAYLKTSRFRAAINKDENLLRIFKEAQMIEGLIRQQGTHAAGVVIAKQPLNNFVPTTLGLDGYNQVQFTMDHLEDHGLLKIDILGLRNLTIVQKIQKEVLKNYSKSVSLHNIPLNDEKTNELLRKGHTNGIFQLESPGMKKTLMEVGVDSFDDLVAIISLFRPGPMEFIKDYANVKKGISKIETISPEYDEIVSPTNGIIIYQEQIMLIAQKISNMSFSQADILRRAISKKKFEDLEFLREKFIAGALENGYSIVIANKIFTIIEKFANYGFNKSHAVAYGILAYWMAYLKIRFPFEFYTALMNSSLGSQEMIAKQIQEASSSHISILSPHILHSYYEVYNKEKQIVLPLHLIKGFGLVASEKLITERDKKPFEDFFDFVTRSRKVGVGESALTLLIEANAVRCFGNVDSLLATLPIALNYFKLLSNSTAEDEDGFVLEKPEIQVLPRDVKRENQLELSLMGFSLNSFMTYGHELEEKLIDLEIKNEINVVVLIESIKIIKDKNQEEMAILKISDSTKSLDIYVFSHLFQQAPDFKKGNLINLTISKNIYAGQETYRAQRIGKIIHV